MDINFFPCRTNTARKDGGLGSTNIPLVADINHNICRDYGVLKEEDGIAYRYGKLVLKEFGKTSCR